MPDDVVARIEGKALDLETPVPTPGGWGTMGELESGTGSLHPDGIPVPVIAVSEPMIGRACREVLFSDGTGIVADLDHGGRSTHTTIAAGKRRVLTTRELAGAPPREGVPLDRDQSAPVEYAEQELPIDPYVLGAWIGDGTSTAAIITNIDQPVLREVELAGYAVQRASGPIAYRIGGVGQTRDGLTGQYTRNESLNSTLRGMGSWATSTSRSRT